MRAMRSVFAVLALAIACGGDTSTPTGNNPPGGENPPPTGGPPPGGGETTNMITVNDNFFTPLATTVPANTTVTWTWEGGNAHDVTFSNASVGNSARQTTGTFSRTFTTAGTYSYLCTVHGSSMSGSVTVQ